MCEHRQLHLADLLIKVGLEVCVSHTELGKGQSCTSMLWLQVDRFGGLDCSRWPHPNHALHSTIRPATWTRRLPRPRFIVCPSTQKSSLSGKCSLLDVAGSRSPNSEPRWTRTMQVPGEKTTSSMVLSKRQSLRGGRQINTLARHGSIPQTLYHQKIPVQLLVSFSRLRLFNNLGYISTNLSKSLLRWLPGPQFDRCVCLFLSCSRVLYPFLTSPRVDDVSHVSSSPQSSSARR